MAVSMTPKPGITIGQFRVVKRTKELIEGYPYYVAVDLPGKSHAWYLHADGSIQHEAMKAKKSPSDGWFASMDAVMAAIALYEGTTTCATA